MSQSDFAVKVKGQTKIGRKIDKRTAMIEKHTTLSDSRGKQKVAQKWVHRQK